VTTKKTQSADTVIQTSARMKKSVHKRFKQIAFDNDMSHNQLIDEAIELVLKKYTKKHLTTSEISNSHGTACGRGSLLKKLTINVDRFSCFRQGHLAV
jgi:hypothetical protein